MRVQGRGGRLGGGGGSEEEEGMMSGNEMYYNAQAW